MNRKQKIFIFAIVVIVVILFGIFVRTLSTSYPLNNNAERDFLSILADVGEAVGAVAIFLLVFEIFKRELDAKRRSTPRIAFPGHIHLDWSPPEDAVKCLVEIEENQLPLENTLGREDLYEKMWMSMERPNPATDCYLKVKVENQNLNSEASVSKLFLHVHLFYENEHAGRVTITRKFWGPRDGLAVPSGTTKHLYIRCGKMNDPRLQLVSGKIVDYRCHNFRNDVFVGSKRKFSGKKIEEQRLVAPTDNPGLGDN